MREKTIEAKLVNEVKKAMAVSVLSGSGPSIVGCRIGWYFYLDRHFGSGGGESHRKETEALAGVQTQIITEIRF